MRLSKKVKIELFALLIILNVILRYTITPHEIGWDSFVVHISANSVSTFGYARWWLHPTSIIGSYPYSMPSAVPFILSGISQSTSVNMERIIWLFCIIIGLFSIFTAYLMAGTIWNNDLFKFLVAFIFSTSQGVLTYSTWTITTRGLFIILLPLFFYSLLKTRTFIMRYGLLTFVFIIVLLLTHHYVYFTVPIVISFFLVAMFYKLNEHTKSIRIPESLISIIILFSFFVLFLTPFFSRSVMEFERGFSGSWYAFVLDMPQDWIRYIGFLAIFAVGGYTYLLLKDHKSFGEWFLLLVLVFFAPLLYIKTYIKWIIISFAALLIGMGLANIANVKTSNDKKKYVPTLIVILLLLSASFTGYYQSLHFLDDPSPYKRHMEERTYIGGLWIKDNIGEYNNMIGPGISTRVFSISGVPLLTGAGCIDLAYGFVEPDEVEVEQIYSPLSLGFYYNDPYKLVNQSSTDWDVGAIASSDITERGSWAWRLVPKYNISYFVENKDISSVFTRSIQQTKENIYDNGKICIWSLDKI